MAYAGALLFILCLGDAERGKERRDGELGAPLPRPKRWIPRSPNVELKLARQQGSQLGNKALTKGRKA